MKKFILTIFICLFATYGWAQEINQEFIGHSNPAAQYCLELGYQIQVVEEADGAQHSMCVFPDNSECDVWQFFDGSCGQDKSYCAQQGYGIETVCDGKDPFSTCYAVCTDSNGNPVGSVTELMGFINLYRRPFEQGPVTTTTTVPAGTTTVPTGTTTIQINSVTPGTPVRLPASAPLIEAALPASFDWRTYLGSDWMTSVKDQSECGACWAFSAVGATEATYNIHEGDPNLDINLSEEYLNSDCDKVESGSDAGSCCGGSHTSALDFIKNYGISDEACMPFIITGKCSCFGGPGCGSMCAGLPTNCSSTICSTGRCPNYADRLVKIKDYVSVPSNKDDMKQNLIAHGPLSVCLAMSGKFDAQNVYNCQTCWDHNGNGICDTGSGTCDTTTKKCTAGSVGANCSKDSDCVEDTNGDGSCDENDCGINHCVVITGYDDANNAWIVKNSWGNTWGKSGDGYFNVGYGECHIENVPYYVEAEDLNFPEISVPGNIAFADTCVGATSHQTLNVCNTGKEDLKVASISNSGVFSVTTPSTGYPVTISPDFCYPFQVSFAPTSATSFSGMLNITSNDIGHPSVSVIVSGKGTVPILKGLMAGNGQFGDVCLGSFRDLELTISNSGGCDLSVNNIISTVPAEFKAVSTFFPLIIHAGDSIQIPIRFQPISYGSKTAVINVTTNAGDLQTLVSGNVPKGEMRVTGSPDFGNVCPGTLAEKTLKVCNVGKCNINVASAAFDPPCADFTLIKNPFPAAVSPDSCLDLVVRFTPTSIGPKSCTLVIESDASNAPVSVTVTANTPTPMIDVPPDLCFPPTVIQSIGPCSSAKPFPISNTGICNLEITDISIDNPDYSLSGLPSYPIILEPGHVVGEGDLKVVFKPTALARSIQGTITVKYLSDPITGATTSITRTLQGEGVRTGARVLVTANGVPMANVAKLQIQRITGNRNKKLVKTVESAMRLDLQTVDPGAPCAPFQYHREYGTVSNELMLLPGSYLITATGVVNGKRKSVSVGFNADTCTFNQTITINLP
jgi:C1A family cysteine protease/putative hemolysin